MERLKRLKNEKGLNSIELVIIALILIILIAALIDLTNIMKMHTAVSTSANYISRTIGKQGGVRKVKPTQYRGSYTTSSELYNAVKRVMNSSAIIDKDWKVTITDSDKNKYILSPTTDMRVVDYKKNMYITVSFNYSWNLLASATPIRLKGKNTAYRISESKFKVRNDTKNKNTVEGSGVNSSPVHGGNLNDSSSGAIGNPEDSGGGRH